MAQKLTPVDAYIRVSRVGDRQGDRFISPDLQRQSIERVCKREGLKVVEWFEELDASGGDKTRPKWNEAIRRVEEGKTKGLVCWNLDRFSRSQVDGLMAYERVESAGGKVYSEEGNLSKLDRGIRFAIAEDMRDRAKANFRNSTISAIARGIYIARRIPFGYVKNPQTRRLEIDPATSPIVVELFERRSKSVSWSQLSKWAQETHGIYFPRETLHGMLGNVAYLGHARSGDIVNEKAHEPIVSRKLWDAAQKAKGRKPVHTGAAKSLLLRGFTSCGTCGHTMVVGYTKGKVIERGETWQEAKREKVTTYTCRNLACEGRAYGRAALVDAHVTASLLTLLSLADAKIINKTNDPKELAQAEKDFEDAEYALDAFKKNRKAISILGVDAWNELLEEYVVARDTAEMQRDALKEDNSDDEWNLVPELWAEWTIESRREFLRKVITDCTIHPAHGEKIPVEDRIEIGFQPSGMTGRLNLKDLPEGWELEIHEPGL